MARSTRNARIAFEEAPLGPVADCPGLVAHQAEDPFTLWRALECGGRTADVPYWSLIWPAARVLARLIQREPERVADRAVLELACGGAIPAIAAARSGARPVVALDHDPLGVAVARRNAKANHCDLEVVRADVLRAAWPDTDLILVADFFYRRTDAAHCLERLAARSASGSEIWIADAGRPFGPPLRGESLADVMVPVSFAVEGTRERRVRVQRFPPGTLDAPPGR